MKLTVNAFLTLDGVMQGPGSADEDTSGGFAGGGWMINHMDPAVARIATEWFDFGDALLLGRTTYELLWPYWQDALDPLDLVADHINRMPKYLVSTTLTDPGWNNTRLIRGDVLAGVQEIKAHGTGEVQVHGSYQLARSLYDAGLVDGYRLLILPVTVGAGKRLFNSAADLGDYALTRKETTDSGALAVTLVHRAADSS
ncbi:dihydrofolate reductase family protein [Arthrobacter sp. zg-Y20]|uniref:dihydrofolate reductase family protein n=1 Tax=unclassified Arthrobacter TaxID=235627 RepID=UPI001D14D646|nr:MULTISPECIES: dihydrofolate reductase family protein [unclassified Arthrobacter]MCC3275212.1 dihydrofolate reductase family protein [Arthrobacter sp. zg-Y20]MDK1315369.1 dihydrofolate reductase family protein [Arthrobacter sp. zg.Y20]WIB05787.1 dihydrofolate reductase family protein [Arthrobacter sp. zg-Y20]